MYYHDEPYCEQECCGCEAHEETLRNLKDFFSGVLENLYNANKYNEQDLENCLDEMAGYLGMKLPRGELQVRGAAPMTKILEDWKVMNNAYLQSLAPKTFTVGV